MELQMTKEASAFLAILYREYCARRKQGMSIEDSAQLGDDTSIQSSLTPKLLLDDVTHLCWQLNKCGILHAFPGDNRANDVSITDKGILFMQEQFPRGIKDALDWLEKLAPLIPWL